MKKRDGSKEEKKDRKEERKEGRKMKIRKEESQKGR